MKMNMTDNNVLRHFKKLNNKRTPIEFRNIFREGHTLAATDSHRALIVDEYPLPFEHTVNEEKRFDKIKSLISTQKEEVGRVARYVFFKEDLKPLRDVLKLMKTLGYSRVEFTVSDDKEHFTIQGTKESLGHKPIEAVDFVNVSYELGQPSNKVYLDEIQPRYVLNINYLLDVILFCIDTKEEKVYMHLHDIWTKAIHFTGEHDQFDYIVLPIRLY